MADYKLPVEQNHVLLTTGTTTRVAVPVTGTSTFVAGSNARTKHVKMTPVECRNNTPAVLRHAPFFRVSAVRRLSWEPVRQESLESLKLVYIFIYVIYSYKTSHRKTTAHTHWRNQNGQ
jgi:hypothetical protein